MRRVVVLFAFLLGLLAPAAGAADAPTPDIYQARAEAGGEHDSIAVPAYFETFFPYSLSEASNGSAHGYHAVFYGGFFLTAAAEQFGFPPPPGTTETLYPQGPTQKSAEAIPNEAGGFGESAGMSGPSGSSGSATAGGGVVPGLGRIGFGETSTSVAAEAKKVTSTARVLMNDVTIAGVVHIGSIAGEATAVATGAPGGATTTGNIVLSDLTVAGIPVAFTSPLPGPSPLDAVLAQTGVSVTRLPDVRTVSPDGTRARLLIGGIMITLSRPEREFTVTFTFGRLDVSARAESVAPFIRTRLGGALTEELLEEFDTGIGPLSAVPPLPEVGAPQIRSVRRSVVPVGADYSVLAALIAVMSLAALFSPRVLHSLVD